MSYPRACLWLTVAAGFIVAGLLDASVRNHFEVIASLTSKGLLP